MWLAGSSLVSVLALTGYVIFGGDESGPGAPAKGGQVVSAAPFGGTSPVPTYAAPEEWTEPERWVALPRGQRTDQYGSEVGFPHSTEGAAAMMKAASTTTIEADRSTVDEQLRIYRSFIGKTDHSAQNAQRIEANAASADETLAREMKVSPGQPLPPGAYVRSHVVGYQVVQRSGDEVSAYVLARVTQKTGETAKESATYTRSLLGVQWQDGDWKLTSAASMRAKQMSQGKPKPKMGAPGDIAFNEAGWTAIREAS
ncbi:hypothetical protein [Streptomyces ficellus]|nr:hypothetical protein [Streptomyces ficellus]